MRGDSISSDKDWQAESDARTLVEANRIRKDPKRFAAAKKAAQRKLDEAKKDAATIADMK